MGQSNVISVSPGGTLVADGERSIGAILVQAGRITPEQNERILSLQRERALRFGNAGIMLGLLTPADIEFALSQQFKYPHLTPGTSKVSQDLIAPYCASGPRLEALRALRSQLMLRWFDVDPGHRALSIVSGDRGEGRTFIAANLAVAFSLLGRRTLLIDADMRNPRQHKLFGVDNRVGLSALLTGRGGSNAIHCIPSLLDLSVLPAGIVPPNPPELLAQPLFQRLLKELGQEFDVILLDSPAASECADAQTIAVRAGAALIVARKNYTGMWRLKGVSNTVSQSSATVIGTVLNDF